MSWWVGLIQDDTVEAGASQAYIVQKPFRIKQEPGSFKARGQNYVNCVPLAWFVYIFAQSQPTWSSPHPAYRENKNGQ